MVQQSLANINRSLTYDAVGNILNINDGASQYSYGYDAMSRLLSANNLSYGYDLNGNRLMAELNNYSYVPSSNKLLTVSGTVSKNYQYDGSGNAVSDGLHSYSYNAENQLAEVIGVASYLYNGLGQRVAKNVGGVLSHYAYDEQARLIGEYNATGQVVNETVYLFGQPVAVLKGAEVFNVHTDHSGSPRKITNQAGSVVWLWTEKPFGDAPANQDPDNDGVVFEYNLRFPGQFFDKETGLYYNYHRYYDSQTGRYITSDPIGLAGGLNTYGYARGNPVNRIDPEGLQDSVDAAIQQATMRGDIVELRTLLEAANPEQSAVIQRLLTPARDLIRASLKRVKGYPSEIEEKSFAEICKMASDGGKLASKAKKIKKLIQAEERLLEKY